MQRVSMNNYCYYTSCKLNLPLNEKLRKTMYYDLNKIDLPTMAKYTISNVNGSSANFTVNQIVNG